MASGMTDRAITWVLSGSAGMHVAAIQPSLGSIVEMSAIGISARFAAKESRS